jgi:hypothetical protein
MWRAAGGDLSKQPSNWLASARAREFIEFLTPGIFGSLVHTAEGRGGGTWAHWQLAMAYAKYLSPEFQASAPAGRSPPRRSACYCGPRSRDDFIYVNLNP